MLSIPMLTTKKLLTAICEEHKQKVDDIQNDRKSFTLLELYLIYRKQEMTVYHWKDNYVQVERNVYNERL